MPGDSENDLDNSRLPAWEQPERPEWVRRFNEEGALLDMASVCPLDSESLLSQARRNTGLDNFGDDDWREPFEVLVGALEDEAQLTPLGRVMTRADLVTLLEGRLKVEDLYTRHPEVDDEVIDKPFFIVGQGRSGTTYLQRLMGLPPGNRTTTDVDGLWPIRERGREAEYEQRALDRMRMWSRVTPQVESIHDFAATTPCETIRLEAFSFRCPAWLNLLGLTPTFNAWLGGQSVTLPLSYAKRILKAQQFLDPGYQWVLKSPEAIGYLPKLLEVFPDARLIWGHRDPIKAMSSMVDMIGTMMFIRSDQKLDAAYEFVTNPAVVAPIMEGPIDLIENGSLPKDRLYNVQYGDLMDDPVAVVAAIYQHFGEPFLDEAQSAIAKYVRDNPRTKRPAHEYSTGKDKQVSAERAAFRRYQSYFAVPDEV